MNGDMPKITGFTLTACFIESINRFFSADRYFTGFGVYFATTLYF